MIHSLIEQKSALAHIYEEYESSSDSLLFVHGMISAFCQDLLSTSHVRKAEITTMTTPQGIELRKLVLSMHDNLAKEVAHFILKITSRMHEYSKVVSHVRKNTEGMFEAMKEVNIMMIKAEHTIASYHQTQDFFTAKTERISLEIGRLQSISQQISRKNHVNNLKQVFRLELTDSTSSELDNSHHDPNYIKVKLEDYQKEQEETTKLTVRALNQYDQDMRRILAMLKVV